MVNFKSKITEKVLGYYFLNPQARKYINELARTLDVDPGNLDRKLKELEDDGLFISEISGQQKFYALNKRYPLLAEIKKIYSSQFGLKHEIAEILVGIRGIKEAYIFGSCAKETMRPDSDIDLLLIGSHRALEAKKQLIRLEKKYQREINTADLTEKEFEQKKKRKDEFIDNIFKNSIIKLI